MTEEIHRSNRWVSAFETGHEYEADLVRDRLDENGIPAVVFTQRDHSFNLTIGDVASVHVMVQMDRLEDALAVLAQEPESDEDLDRASQSADPDAAPAHDEHVDSLLDSSLERIRFITDDDQVEDDETQA